MVNGDASDLRINGTDSLSLWICIHYCGNWKTCKVSFGFHRAIANFSHNSLTNIPDIFAICHWNIFRLNFNVDNDDKQTENVIETSINKSVCIMYCVCQDHVDGDENELYYTKIWGEQN